jgi:Tol biopolymer transport system component
MRWIVQSILACGAVLLVAVALIFSLLVIMTLVPGLRGPTISTQPGLQSGVGRIAFVGHSQTGARDIFIMHADGSGQVNLTDSPEPKAAPTWSPQGDRIVFRVSQDGQDNLAVTNLNGIVTPLTDGGYSPSWSPDGEHIAFVSRRNAEQWPDVSLVTADGSLHHRITRTPAAETRPRWSPNGHHIAFSTGAHGSVYVIDADGTNQQKLGDGDTPTWSPDSTQLAFTSTEPGVGIQVVDVTGALRYTIAGITPHWSPQGTHIAFLTRFQGGERASMMIVEANGAHPQTLVEDIPWWTDLQWSPDGRWMVFTNGLTLHPEQAWISIINIDGSDRTRLADGSQPTWQPRPE